MAVNGRDKVVEKYMRTSRQFIEQAFNRGDMLQASEKAWGAAAQASPGWE